MTVIAGLTSGVMNLCLAKAGYIAPEFVEATGETIGFVQNAATQNVFTFFFLGGEIITAVLLVAVLAFLNVEKVIGKEQEEIKARREADR